MNSENWTEERERLERLIRALASGKITHIDEDDLRQLQPTNQKNIAALKARLDELNDRLGFRPGDTKDHDGH